MSLAITCFFALLALIVVSYEYFTIDKVEIDQKLNKLSVMLFWSLVLILNATQLMLQTLLERIPNVH